MAMDPIDYFSPNSSYSRAAAPRVQTAYTNYITTIRQPTAVTHSCCGTFTSRKNLNLLICKGSVVSIYVMTNGGSLEHLVDFPMFARVVFMEISPVAGSVENILFIANEIGLLCMFGWDVKASNVVSRHTMNFRPTLLTHGTGNEAYDYLHYIKGGTISPDGKVVVLYYMQNELRVVDIDALGHGTPRFKKIFSSATKIMDAKFLNGVRKYEFALLYVTDGNFCSGIYKIDDINVVAIRLFQHLNTVEPTSFLVPTLDRYLIIGRQGVIYVDDEVVKTTLVGNIDVQVYARVDETPQKCVYFLSGQDKHIFMIEIVKNEDDTLPRLTLRPVAKTPEASSSITYLCNGVVFIGSLYADSQLLKMHKHTPSPEVLKIFTNSGPVIDFSVNNKPVGFRKLVMCCGTHDDSSLEVLITGVGVNEKSFVGISDVKRIWSLKYSHSDSFHTFLVLQVSNRMTRMLVINGNGDIVTHDLDGLAHDKATVCCHEAGDDHRGDNLFIQVTDESVRLIGSKDGSLRTEWSPEPRSKIMLASATTKQVLLSTNDQRLIYLQIGYNSLVEGMHLDGYDVSCLDISPIGDNASSSKLAVVGVWREYKVFLLSLPQLDVLATEHFESIPKCVLLCDFEGVSYLLCALLDETLSAFRLVDSQLQEKVTRKLKGLHQTLRRFLSGGLPHVLLATETAAPKLIFIKDQQLQDNMLNLTDVEDVCPFHRPDLSEGLAIVKENGVMICSMGDVERNAKTLMTSYGRRICHQDETESYVVLVEEKKQPGADFARHLVQLLDKALSTLSFFRLNEGERGVSVISCSFAGQDQHAYYCVGTSLPTEEGRILVLKVTGGKLNLVSQTTTNGGVTYLKALHGGLLGIAGGRHCLYFEWRLHGGLHSLYGNSDLAGTEAGGTEERVALISSRFQQYELHDINSGIEPRFRARLTAMHKLQNDSTFYSDELYNIYSSAGFDNSGIPNKVGKWHFGEFITQMKAGTLARMSDEDYAQLPSVVFSTLCGRIGVIVSLPLEVYQLLKKIQVSMRTTAMGKGCPYLRFPYRCVGLSAISPTKEFLDGNLIESFPTLALEDQISVAEELKLSVELLKEIAAYFTRFR